MFYDAHSGGKRKRRENKMDRKLTTIQSSVCFSIVFDSCLFRAPCRACLYSCYFFPFCHFGDGCETKIFSIVTHFMHFIYFHFYFCIFPLFYCLLLCYCCLSIAKRNGVLLLFVRLFFFFLRFRKVKLSNCKVM